MIEPNPVIRRLSIVFTLQFALLLLFSAGPAYATVIRTATETCPICDALVQGSDVWSTNSFGGGDLDFCPHARGTNIIPHLIWSCPSCGYSGYRDDFTASATRSLRKEISAWLTANLPPASIPQNAWEGFEVRALLAQHLNESDLAIGRLYLRAAWCCRVVGVIDGRTRDRTVLAEIYNDHVTRLLAKLQDTDAELVKIS
ncbi:MAG TPA: DUF2225 domain-containing protein, partial [Candidatus Ozemobacteraceae bacterium]|nr:DUF2225 domain-containing protein [Candidatus Ozemobacteraceae bacterium]